jgi:hypothetical protein
LAETINVHRESLPPLPALEREWRAQERLAGRGFFLSWAWIGTWLATLPAGAEPFLLRAKRGGTTIGIALGVERSGALYLNATGNRDLDTIYISNTTASFVRSAPSVPCSTPLPSGSRKRSRRSMRCTCQASRRAYGAAS